MLRDTEKLIEIFGPCTEDIRDCEIMRLAITVENPEHTNEQTLAIRQQLARSACEDCVAAYLADVKLLNKDTTEPYKNT